MGASVQPRWSKPSQSSRGWQGARLTALVFMPTMLLQACHARSRREPNMKHAG